MQEAAVSPLTDWGSFYVIVGSSAAALTGLMFVVITLTAGIRERMATSSGGVATFSTPNVVHFGAALLVAAILSAPWPALGPAAVLLGLTGLGGVGYVGIVVRRLIRSARLPNTYTPVLEDWLGHSVLPLAAYAVLLVAALLLPGDPTPALFAFGAATVLLIFAGIHNAWDTITYLTLEFLQNDDEKKE
jgi:hypothetical protein